MRQENSRLAASSQGSSFLARISVDCR